MKYCSLCGARVTLEVPAGDDRQRYVCSSCREIHYQNPKIVAGSLPVWGNQVLLCRRAIDPRYGFWTLPAGFMENDETTEQAALRETLEEARAQVDIDGLYVILNLPEVNQVYMMFRATLRERDFGAGHESLEVRLFREEDIPWDQIAFRTIRHTLEFFFADRGTGRFPLHTGDIVRMGNGYQYRPGSGSA